MVNKSEKTKLDQRRCKDENTGVRVFKKGGQNKKEEWMNESVYKKRQAET